MSSREEPVEDREASAGSSGRDQEQGAPDGSTGTPMTQQIGRVVVGVLVLLFLVFAFYNGQDVTVDWLFTTTETPLIVVLIGSFALGALVGVVLLWRSQRGRARSDRSAERG